MTAAPRDHDATPTPALILLRRVHQIAIGRLYPHATPAQRLAHIERITKPKETPCHHKSLEHY